MLFCNPHAKHNIPMTTVSMATAYHGRTVRVDNLKVELIVHMTNLKYRNLDTEEEEEEEGGENNGC